MAMNSPWNWKKAEQIKVRLKPLVSKIDKVREQRNHVFHAYWRPSFTYDAHSESIVRAPGVAESIRHRKKPAHGHLEIKKSWTLSELQTLSADIKDAACQLDDFVTWANKLVVERKLFSAED